jgi:CheY-like chemotaxis protein
LNTLPIIVLTAKDLSQHEREQLTHSAVAVLPTSGFSKQRFLQELERAVASGAVMR